MILHENQQLIYYTRSYSNAAIAVGHGRICKRVAGGAWKEALDQAESLTDLHVPGFDFHDLQGVPKRYSIHVNGPWCITFEWGDGDALRVDLEQYH